MQIDKTRTTHLSATKRRALRLALELLLLAVMAHESMANQPQPITFVSLLREMPNLKLLPEYPFPEYTAQRFSSYDRTPSHDSVPGWFGDADHGYFIDTIDDGVVMMDAKGPGVITHIWSARSNGSIAFYFDSATTPSWIIQMSVLLKGTGPIPAPFSTVTAQGENCYFPIPYQKHCKIVFSGNTDIYYQIDYRTYPAATPLQTFSPDFLGEQSQLIDSIGKILVAQSPRTFDEPYTLHSNSGPINQGDTILVAKPDGPGAIEHLEISLISMSSSALLRSCFLEISFDNASYPQVRAPIGDFFGAVPHRIGFQTLPIEIRTDQTMVCRFVMPYKQSAQVRLVNYGNEQGSYSARLMVRPYEFSARTMHFFARWRQDPQIEISKNLYWIIYMAEPYRDHPMLHITGKGVHVGTILQIWNREEAWWGEGDDKIWVDDDTFPSFMGTGTEDYFGYAWSTTTRFSHAYHAQPHADGFAGFVTNARFHISDPQPFTKRYRFDMEIQTAFRPTKIDFGRGVFFYAFDSTTTDHDTLTDDDLYLHEDLPAPTTTTKSSGSPAMASMRYDRSNQRLIISQAALAGKPTIRILRLDARTAQTTINPPRAQIDISHLAPGMYIAEVNAGTLRQRIRFMRE